MSYVSDSAVFASSVPSPSDSFIDSMRSMSTCLQLLRMYVGFINPLNGLNGL